MVRGDHLPFDLVVLTAEGIQDPRRQLETRGYRVVRCGYDDSPDLSQARFKIERCAPEIAAAIKAGARTLVLCAAGENRSAAMTARVRYLLTGEAGTSIVASMRAVPRSEGHTFSNGVFRRWAESWPAKAPSANGDGFSTTTLVLAGLTALGAIGIFVATVWGPTPQPNRKRPRRNPVWESKPSPRGGWIDLAGLDVPKRIREQLIRLEAQWLNALDAVDRAYERQYTQRRIDQLEVKAERAAQTLEDAVNALEELELGDDPLEGAGIESSFAHVYASYTKPGQVTYGDTPLPEILRGVLASYDYKASQQATDRQLVEAAQDAYQTVVRRRQRNRPRRRRGSCDPLLWSQPRQAITSSKTALRQVPAVYKRVKLGRVNADIGGGPYQDATRYLRKRGTRNVVYDPFNRPSQENARAKSAICASRANTATAANVLNVIRSKSARRRVIEQAADAIGKGGIAYFQVYEGDQSGRGKPTPRGWQENRRTRSYLPEIRTIFRSTEQRGNIIAAWEPK